MQKCCKESIKACKKEHRLRRRLALGWNHGMRQTAYALNNTRSVESMKMKRANQLVVFILGSMSTLTLAANYALQFDGTSDEVVIEHSDSLNVNPGDELTVEFWYMSFDNSDIYHVLGKRSGCGTFAYQVAYEPSFGIQHTHEHPPINEWHHLACVYKDNAYNSYLDGLAIGSSQPWVFGSPGDVPLKIGQSGTCFDSQRFLGVMDEVRIWNYARTESEILYSMNRTLAGAESGLVGYWGFDDGSGQIAYDYSEYGNHGQLGTTAGSDAGDPTWVVSSLLLEYGFMIFDHDPSAVVTTPVNYVDVTFSDEVDPTTFTSDDISMFGPSGTIDVNEPESQGENVWRISFETQSDSGEYHVYIGPHIRDTNENEMDQDGNGTGGEDPNDVYDASFHLTDGHVFTSDTLIDSGDTDYEGERIVVSDCTLTINGVHDFSSIHILSGGIITHSAASNDCNLTVTGDMTVDEDGTVDANGKGFEANDGPGAGDGGVGGGGGYGGFGGRHVPDSDYGSTYGSIKEPNHLGSGGGAGSAAGGGAIRLTVAGTLTVNGSVTADGDDNIAHYSYGAASGGSIWITADTLTGSGMISATGGDVAFDTPAGGGGGGGRIAVYYDASDFTGTVSASGGTGGSNGGAGTIFTKQNADPLANVLVDNSGIQGEVTPLDTPDALDDVVVACSNEGLVYIEQPLTVGGIHVRFGGVLSHGIDCNGLDLTVLGDVVVDANGAIDASGKGFRVDHGPGHGDGGVGGGGGYGGFGGRHVPDSNYGSTYGSIKGPNDLGSGGSAGAAAGGGAIKLAVAGTLTVNGSITADGDDNITHFTHGAASGGSIWIMAGSLAGSGMISANGGDVAFDTPAGGGGGGGRIAVYYEASDFTGTVSASGGTGGSSGGAGTILTKRDTDPLANVLVDNSGIQGDATPLDTPDALDDVVVAISGGSIVYTGEGLAVGGMHVYPGGTLSHEAVNSRLDLIVIGDMTVDVNGAVDANGKGFEANNGPGAGCGSAGGGGGYGGFGGRHLLVPGCGSTYGSEWEPYDLGSGGGAGSAAGGGAIKLTVTGMLTVDGSVTADGDDNTGHFSYGAASGGSIWIMAGTLAGSGIISANGGDVVFDTPAGGGGGGGRIAVCYDANDFSGELAAEGGIGGENGDEGTIWISDYEGPPFLINPQLPSELLSGSVDYIDLKFSEPMNEASLQGGIQIWGTAGAVEIIDFQMLDSIGGVSVYRITFGAMPDGAYELRISANIEDLDGEYLDQDRDGIGGEDADGISSLFSVDTTGPRINRHEPAGDNGGIAEYVDVWFSEAVLPETFTTSAVVITGPSGPVAPNSVDEVGFNCYRISFSPQTVYGEYIIDIRPDAQDMAGNVMDQNRNYIQGEDPNDYYTASFNLVDVDLVISGVTVDSGELWAGDFVQISWEGSNESGAPLLGDWTDGVYLSSDDKWDIEDELLATVSRTGGLLGDETYSASVDVVVPGRVPGDYHIIVRSDLYNEEMEESDEGNNATALGPIPLNVHSLLLNDTPVDGSLSAEDMVDYYAVDVNAGENLMIVLDGLPADTEADLYVSYQTIPTQLDYDFHTSCDAYRSGRVVVPGGLRGSYYILVYGKQTGEPNYYEVTAANPDVALERITPERHGVNSACTMTLVGAGFDDSTSVKFRASDESIREPNEISVLSPTEMIASLDVQVWEMDLYDVIVEKPACEPSELSDAFEVASSLAHFEARVVLPGALGYHWPSTLWIEYENTGTTSMPAPLLKLHGTDDALLTQDKSIQQQWWSWGSWWEGDPPSSVTDSIQVMATGSGETPGILQPGDSGRIPVYFLGLRQPWDFADRSIGFELGGLTDDSTDAIDWESLRDEIQPDWLAADAWDAVWANFTAQIGSTWGDYARMLNANTDYLHQKGRSDISIADLLALEFRKADGLSPLNQLSSSTDLTVPAPGLSLGFSRSYDQPISRRYQLGILGRGWTHSWQIYLEKDETGKVTIFDMTGTPRAFEPDGRGGYISQKGDHGTLASIPGEAYELRELNGLLFKFNSDGTLAHIEDTNGNRVTCGYSAGNLDSLTHTNGRMILIGHYPNGTIQYIADPRGDGTEDDYVVTYDYDPTGEYLTGVSWPDRTGSRRISYTYETAGTIQQRHALTSIEYPDNSSTYYLYDELGRLTQTHRDDGLESVAFLSGSDASIAIEDAGGKRSEVSFGPNGKAIQLKDGLGNLTELSYDTISQSAGITGPLGERYEYSYDSRGNLEKIEDPLNYSTKLTYETTFNSLDLVQDPHGNAIDYAYDTSGQLTSITYQNDTKESFEYDSAGNITLWRNRRGDSVSFVYDSNGLMRIKDYNTTPDIVDFEYSYDVAGNMLTAKDSSGITTMAYDPNTNWLILIKYPGGLSFEFEYDDVGRRTKRTDQNGVFVSYAYDSLGRLDQMTDANSNLIVDYEYDAAGRMSKKTLGNGVYTTYGYDAAGQLPDLINYSADHSILSSFAYTYDASGLRTSTATLDGTYSYEYDPIGQLTKITYPDGRAVQYVYDAAGNRTSVIDDGATTGYLANNMNQYTQVGGTTYTYDHDGNLKTKIEDDVMTTYSYDVENRLVAVSAPNDVWTYEYDALGNRAASTHNGVITRYVVDPIGYGDVASERSSDGMLIAEYLHGLGLIAQVDTNNVISYYTFDAIGSTSEVADSTGVVLDNYRYGPFGIFSGEPTVIHNPFRFIGEYGVMAESNGLSCMRARFYDSYLGRFIQGDPIGIGGGLNSYTYADNNPVSNLDPQGLLPIGTAIGGGVGGLLGGLHGRHIASKCGATGFAFWGEIVSRAAVGVVVGGVIGTGIQYGSHVEPFHLKLGGDLGHIGWQFPWTAAASQGLHWKYQGAHYRIAPIVSGLAAGAVQLWSKPWFCGWSQDTPIMDPNTDPLLSETGETGYLLDPNKKIGPKGYGSSGFIWNSQLLAYEIQFENVPDATAPAHLIRVTDSLDEDLDLDTFELTEIAFADHAIQVPEGLNHYETTVDLSEDGVNLLCQIEAVLDLDTRELTLTMIGVDPETGWLSEDFMLGILYPNDETGRGEGHISYVVRPKTDLPTGTEITNKATIYFDWNDPIETPLTLNTIDSDIPTSEVTYLPAESPMVFVVSWSWNDESGEVASYDIYVSVDGNDDELWLEDYTEAKAPYAGDLDHTYAFYSIAKDGVGHIEDPPSGPDATTTVKFGPGDITGNRIVDFGDFARLAAGWLDYDGFVDIATDGIIDDRDVEVLAEHWLDETQP